MHRLRVRAAQLVHQIFQTLSGTPTRATPPWPRAGYVGRWVSGSGFVEALPADQYRIHVPTVLPIVGERLRLVMNGGAGSRVVHRVKVRRVRPDCFEADRVYRDPAPPREDERLGDD